MSPRALVHRAVWAAIVALTVASCGGGSSSPSSPSTPTTPTTPTAPTTPTPPSTSACSAIGGFVGTLRGITNGTSCSPTTTAVVKLNMKDSFGFSVGGCSGTVIATRAVLTAAHCVGGEVASVLVFQGTGAQVESASFSAHPSYRKTPTGSSGLDIAIVITAADLDRAPVPLLFSREARVAEQATVAGWGKDADGSSAGLLQAGMTAISAVTSTWLETASTMATTNVCSGDSGGPLLLSEGGVWALGGVISATSGGTYCNSGTSYFANLWNSDAQSFIRGLVPGLTSK